MKFTNLFVSLHVYANRIVIVAEGISTSTFHSSFSFITMPPIPDNAAMTKVMHGLCDFRHMRKILITSTIRIVACPIRLENASDTDIFNRQESR